MVAACPSVRRSVALRGDQTGVDFRACTVRVDGRVRADLHPGTQVLPACLQAAGPASYPHPRRPRQGRVGRWVQCGCGKFVKLLSLSLSLSLSRFVILLNEEEIVGLERLFLREMRDSHPCRIDALAWPVHQSTRDVKEERGDMSQVASWRRA